MDRSGARRAVVTLLFTDVAGSTSLTASVGDKKWRALLDRHDEALSRLVQMREGRIVTMMGDGGLAVFDGPAAAIETALDFVEEARGLGLDVRAGIHTGECELRGDEVTGIAVATAARIAERSEPGLVLVSATAKDLSAGADLMFAAHGSHVLRGVPGKWRLYQPGRAKRRPAKEVVKRTSKRAAKGGTTARPGSDGVVRVMVVDDHPLWRQTMKQLLDETPSVEVVDEASDGSAAVAALARSKPDVVLMDIDMPGLNGIDATAAIMSALPSAKVLVLSASEARSHVVGALSAGASGYLPKTSGAREIRDGVARVARGDIVLPSALAAHVVEALRSPEEEEHQPDELASLTDRERDILALMAQGMSNQAICDSMYLSVKTVEGYISNIFMKLGLEPAPDQHRRVLAVLKWVGASGGTAS